MQLQLINIETKELAQLISENVKAQLTSLKPNKEEVSNESFEVLQIDKLKNSRSKRETIIILYPKIKQSRKPNLKNDKIWSWLIWLLTTFSRPILSYLLHNGFDF